MTKFITTLELNHIRKREVYTVERKNTKEILNN